MIQKTQQKAECIKCIKKDSKVQTDVSQTIEKYKKESYSTPSKKGQNLLIQSKLVEQAINIIVDTFEEMDIEIEEKAKKKEFIENKIGLPGSKVIEEMNELGLKNYHPKKVIRLWID